MPEDRCFESLISVRKDRCDLLSAYHQNEFINFTWLDAWYSEKRKRKSDYIDETSGKLVPIRYLDDHGYHRQSFFLCQSELRSWFSYWKISVWLTKLLSGTKNDRRWIRLNRFSHGFTKLYIVIIEGTAESLYWLTNFVMRSEISLE